MNNSDGKSEGVTSGVKDCETGDVKSDEKPDSKQSDEKAEGKKSPRAEQKNVDDDINSIFEKGEYLIHFFN